MPQPDRAPADARRVSDGVDQVRLNGSFGSLAANGEYWNCQFQSFNPILRQNCG